GRAPFDDGVLARLLLEEAGGGDCLALRIVEDHGAALGDYALAAARRVGIKASPFYLVLAGGLLKHESPLKQALVMRVLSACPAAQRITSRFEPAVGALFLALEAAGIAVDRT